MDAFNVIVEQMRNNIDAHAITVISVVEAESLIKRITELQKMEDDYKRAVRDAVHDLMRSARNALIDISDTFPKE